jgi:hypothetical protein
MLILAEKDKIHHARIHHSNSCQFGCVMNDKYFIILLCQFWGVMSEKT